MASKALVFVNWCPNEAKTLAFRYAERWGISPEVVDAFRRDRTRSSLTVDGLRFFRRCDNNEIGLQAYLGNVPLELRLPRLLTDKDTAASVMLKHHEAVVPGGRKAGLYGECQRLLQVNMGVDHVVPATSAVAGPVVSVVLEVTHVARAVTLPFDISWTTYWTTTVGSSAASWYPTSLWTSQRGVARILHRPRNRFYPVECRSYLFD